MDQRQALLDAIFHAAHVGIGVVEDRILRQANDYFFRLFGYSPEELIGKSTRLLYLSQADYERVGHEFYAQIQASGSIEVEARLKHKDGHPIDVLISAATFHAAKQKGPVVFSVLDFTERKAAQERLRESNRRLQEAERIAALGHWEFDPANEQPTWSEEIYRILGLDPAHSPPPVSEHSHLFHPDDVAEYKRLLERTLSTGESFVFTLRIYRTDGALRWLQAEGHAERSSSGRIVRCYGTAQDVTDRYQADERLRQAARVFESTADGVVVSDATHRIMAVNPAFCTITGYQETEIKGQPLELIMRRDPGGDELTDAIWRAVEEHGRWQGELWNRRKDGKPFRARMAVTTAQGPPGQPESHIIVFSDLTSLRETEERLDFLAHHDALTKLPNRDLFRLRLEYGLQRAARDASLLAVLILNLDRFGLLNESLGPIGADRVLTTIGTSLAGALRSADTLARIGGDEFAVILEDLEGPHEIAEVCARLLTLCNSPQNIDGEVLSLTASVGAAAYPVDGTDVETLERLANIALKQAKQRGPGSLQFFEPAMERKARQRLQLESCLRQALPAHELSLHYQPQVRLTDGSLAGAEALLRWNSARLGRVPPGRFVQVAEEMGLISEIGLWVFSQGCEQLVAWERAGHRLDKLAINLSVLQIEQGDLLDEIQQVIRRTGADPARIDLEVTETLIMRQAEKAIASLTALRELGLRLVVDDFGTGYSSLSYLHRLPLQQLKIDKSFVESLPDDPNSRAIARAIIALASSLKLQVLAEGVEREEQAVWLRKAGCDLAQGYLYARPLEAQQFAKEWL